MAVEGSLSQNDSSHTAEGTGVIGYLDFGKEMNTNHDGDIDGSMNIFWRDARSHFSLDMHHPFCYVSLQMSSKG